jgi:hypothetical protein
MPPKNRSPNAEAEAAWRFDRCCPAPNYALSVSTVSSWSASAAHPAPGRRASPLDPRAAAQPQHLGEAVPDHRQRSWADSSAASLPTLTPTARRRSTRATAPMTSTAGVFGPSSTTSQPRDPRTLVTNGIGSPCRAPADPPIIVAAVGSPDAPTYRG